MAAPQVVRLDPVRRQDGLQTPKLTSPSQWIDARVLVQNVAETYTLPAGASILRIHTTNTLYLKWDGTAAVPVDTIDGTSSTVLIANTKRYFPAPNTAYTLSLFTSAAGGSVVTIEAWS